MEKSEKATVIEAWNELEELTCLIDDSDDLDAISYLIEERIATAMSLLSTLFTNEEAIEGLHL